jgi:hypothetical protein
MGETGIPKNSVGVIYAVREKHANGEEKNTGGRSVRM